MKRKKYSRETKRMAEINVVPYIDVMLVLLVIFMVTVPLIHQSVKIELPNADSNYAKDIETLPIILTIDSDRKLYLNVYKDSQEEMSVKDVINHVAAHLQQGNKKPAVMVRGDRNVDYQSILDGILLLKKAGANNVGLITTPGKA